MPCEHLHRHAATILNYHSRHPPSPQAAASQRDRADERDLERIERASRAFLSAKVPSVPALVQQRNREFHFAIYQAAHHPTLMELIEPLGVRCGPCTLALFVELGSEKVKRGAAAQHQAVVNAVCARRSAEAQEAIVADIQATSSRYQTYWQEYAEILAGRERVEAR
jgi:DNA-binding GntR family transcriptional regulator